MDSKQLVAQLLQNPRPENPATMAEWFDAFKSSDVQNGPSIWRAMLGGRNSRCVGFAFAAGYQSAVESLFSAFIDPGEPELASLCVSEANGNHPRAIESRLTKQGDSWTLNGRKAFVSGAESAKRLFIACQSGAQEHQHPLLKVVSLPASAAGVRIEAMPTLPFIPEVSHGRFSLDDVKVQDCQILPGDGYLEYIKPFRTCEDIHVLSALLGYRIGEAIEGKWRHSIIEQHLALALSMSALTDQDLKCRETHLAFAGIRCLFDALIEQTDGDFKTRNPEAFERWERDRALLRVASKAHEIRTENAWKNLS